MATTATLVNITNATASASNVTTTLSSFLSTKDLILFPLRTIASLDRFLFNTVPRSVIQVTGLNVLAQRLVGLVRTTDAAPVVGAVAPVAAEGTGNTWPELIMEAFQTGTNRSYWGMLHYATSRWAVTCVAISLILDRLRVYGSSRQRVILTWNKRLALRLLPIILLISQMHQLLQAIHCQSSPDFSLYRHGDNNKYSLLDWSTDGGPIHSVTSKLLFWSSDEQSCAARGMSRPDPETRASFGSFSLLWPTFLRLSLSHLVENFSCSLQQIQTMTEVGLSVFEHSLAFAEAETMIAHTRHKMIQSMANATTTSTTALHSTLSASPTPSLSPEGSIPASGMLLAITDGLQSLTGPHKFDRTNVPIEVLIVALLSCGNALTAQVFSVLNKKTRWRLAYTAFWGVCYLSAFFWGFWSESEMVRVDSGLPRPVSGLLHFPTVAIVGFLPHIIAILGIILCGIIYVIALLLTAVSLGTNPGLRRPTSLKDRIGIAHDNLQAAIQVRSVTIRWNEDFYTALLRIGFAALTAASEAVFLNEGRAVEMRQFTWLEEERLDELDVSRATRTDEGHFQIVEEYGIPGTSGTTASVAASEWKSGYEKERNLEPKTKTPKGKEPFIYPNPRTDGVGALQRTSRFYLLFIFLRGIIFTIGGWIAFGMGVMLDRVGITARPRWLRRAIGGSLKQVATDRERAKILQENADFDRWAQASGIDGRSRDADIDIEHDMRNRVAMENPDNPQEALDQKMYDWWKGGGWYGTIDESGDYQPPIKSIEQDDDATSVITTTTASANDVADEWESEPEGARTPTQRYASPGWSFSGLRQRRSETPQSETPILDNVTLARLLNPQDQASREEARILSSHLSSDNSIMTRSRYRQQFEKDRTKVLLAGRTPLSTNQPQSSQPQSVRRPLSDEEEAQVLEQLLITRRAQKQRTLHNSAVASTSPTSAAAPDDQRPESGPCCVVCQTEPRTIITWPCRCLTVCEDCRVNLAMNNFGNCVTCRRAVGGFVRLYVP